MLDEIEGYYRFFHDEQISSCGCFEKEKKSGCWKFYDQQGNIIRKSFYGRKPE